MKKVDVKKLILLNMPYLFSFYFADKISSAFRLASGDSFANKLGAGFLNISTAFQSPLPSFNPIDLLIGVVGAAGLRLLLYIKSKNKKNYRHGEEYGSNASWFCCCSTALGDNDCLGCLADKTPRACGGENPRTLSLMLTPSFQTMSFSRRPKA